MLVYCVSSIAFWWYRFPLWWHGWWIAWRGDSGWTVYRSTSCACFSVPSVNQSISSGIFYIIKVPPHDLCQVVLYIFFTYSWQQTCHHVRGLLLSDENDSVGGCVSSPVMMVEVIRESWFDHHFPVAKSPTIDVHTWRCLHVTMSPCSDVPM